VKYSAVWGWWLGLMVAHCSVAGLDQRRHVLNDRLG